ncbi:MAG: PEP-CTERM sorting domain-containing protein [Pirellulales bacterium]|nr:PEP-CTERM sorting domain-containing protein [Pirellulales bacterium]
MKLHEMNPYVTKSIFGIVSRMALSGILLVWVSTDAPAESLLIDFNSTTQDSGPHPQAGYQSYNAGHEVAADFVPVAYSAFGTTVTLTPTWPDTTANTVQQMIDRGAGNDANYIGTMLDLVTDWIGIDARAASGGNGTSVPTTMDLTLSGLPAGDYYYRAYHHDTENQNPDFSITLIDANGTTAIGTFEATASTPHANNPNPVNPGFGFGPQFLPSTVVFPFRSNGGDVVFRYQGTEGANVHESFVLVNGIEIHNEPIVEAEPTLFIDRVTGNMTFSNDSDGPIIVLGYSITSNVGALDPSQWISINENYDADSGDHSVDPDDTWVKLTNSASRTDLSEFELGGPGPNDGALISSGQSFVLGDGAWIRNPTEDVAMMMKLADGTSRPAVVKFIGNNDSAYLPGDFNFDTAVDENDYLILLAGLHTDLSALSGAEAYHMGDMNGDSANNYTDTVLFRTAYDEANGPGAFAAMICEVPEPTSLVLFALVGVACLYFHLRCRQAGRRSTTRGNKSMQINYQSLLFLLMASGLLLVAVATNAYADSLMIDFNSTTQDSGPHPQAGYQSYNAGHEVATDFVPVAYSAFGTTVTLTPTWPDTTANTVQQMIDRTASGPPVTSYDANYLGDMLDLVTDFIGSDGRASQGGNGTTSPTTMLLKLSGLPAGDYYYRAYHHDTEYMNSVFSITLTDANGTAPIGTFEGTGSSSAATNLNPVSGIPGFGPAILSSTVVFPFQSNGSDVVFQYQCMEGANTHESFIVVNGIEIWDQPIPSPVLTLEINTDTGSTRILNTTGNALDINYYEITSASGSLNPAGWNSLDDQNFDAIGSGVGESWDEAGGSDEEILSEIFLHGSTNLANQSVLNLGSSFQHVSGQQDIMFKFGVTTNYLIAGLVEYVTGVDENADFNADGDVDGADFLVWQRGFGTASGANPADGDANGDGAVNAADLAIWKSQFGTGGASAGGLAGTAVPEPSTLGLAGLIFAGFVLGWLRNLKGGQTMHIFKIYLTIGVASVLLFAQNAAANYTLDRLYRMGDDDGVSANDPVYTTYDMASTEGSQFDHLYGYAIGSNNPIYVNTSSRPQADANELGIQFDAAQEHYLEGIRLGSPQTSATGLVENYAGIVNRGFQLWIKPAVATSGGVQQDIVMDTRQHAVGITAGGNWYMQYNGTLTDTGVSVTAGQWYHVMLVRPYGSSGSNSGARMYINGVAVAAATGGYTGEDNFVLSVGVRTYESIAEEPYNFFTGIVDDLDIFVLGTTTSDPPINYGTFNPLEDNAYIAAALTGVAGDVNQDRVLNGTDIDDFVTGWRYQNLVNGIQVGDLNSIAKGDLDCNGITDLDDAFLLHEALLAGGLGGFDFSRLSGVPEPATGWLLLGTLIALGTVRRRIR